MEKCFFERIKDQMFLLGLTTLPLPNQIMHSFYHHVLCGCRSVLTEVGLYFANRIDTWTEIACHHCT